MPSFYLELKELYEGVNCLLCSKVHPPDEMKARIRQKHGKCVLTEIKFQEVGSVRNWKQGSGLFPNPKSGKWFPCFSEGTTMHRP